MITEIVEVVAPFDQRYVPPPVAVNKIVCVAHVRTVVGELIAAVGGVLFCVMFCVTVAVQPFAPVIVTM